MSLSHTKSSASGRGGVACLGFALLVAGCRDPSPSSGAPDSGPAGVGPAPATAVAPGAIATAAPSAVVAHVPETVEDEPVDEHAEACAPADAGLDPMQLLRFVWTSGLEGKDPKDRIEVGRPGQRVYAHLTLRNRSGRERCLELAFEVAGKKRSEVTLKIGKSWSWRTWAYNTMRADDRAPLRLTVKDDQGVLVLDKTLPILPE
jgi:hypothetical protein